MTSAATSATTPPVRRVTIYTDGACLGNPGPGGWAALVIENGQTRELSGYETELKQVWSTDLLRVNRELGRLSLPPLDPQCTEVKGCAAKP